WAGFRLAKDLDPKKYDVTLISPRNHFVFTPLLASTSVGTLEFRNACETIRYHNPTFEAPESSTFDVSYDKLILAVGARVNTFGIKGVQENAYFLKEINDARKIRRRVLDCFEQAFMPGASEETKRRVLNFAVVGGGPTVRTRFNPRVEFSAELHDFVKEDLSRLYPSLMPYVRMTLYDVAPAILTAFDSRLTDIQTRTSVLELKPNSMVLNSGVEIPVGMVVWATGVTEIPLIAKLGEKVKKENKRLATDDRLRLLDVANDQLIDENVYGLGDCASISDKPLPCTAQVAEQQARYLVQVLNKGESEKAPAFAYHNRGIMAYLGNWNAIVQLRDPMPRSENLAGAPATIKQAGRLAWLIWRSAYMSKSVSWRNRLLIPVYWFMTWAFGRD
ncbi:hypothetical protein L0F63_002713, partial [Massospora cicadina]